MTNNITTHCSISNSTIRGNGSVRIGEVSVGGQVIASCNPQAVAPTMPSYPAVPSGQPQTAYPFGFGKSAAQRPEISGLGTIQSGGSILYNPMPENATNTPAIKTALRHIPAKTKEEVCDRATTTTTSLNGTDAAKQMLQKESALMQCLTVPTASLLKLSKACEKQGLEIKQVTDPKTGGFQLSSGYEQCLQAGLPKLQAAQTPKKAR